MRRRPATRETSGPRCVYCHDGLEGQAVERCGVCDVALHRECAAALDHRCPTLGCATEAGVDSLSAAVRYTQILERRDGPLARVGMGIGALLGGLAGVSLLSASHLPFPDAPSVSLAALLLGGMVGALAGPTVLFTLREAFVWRAARSEPPSGLHPPDPKKD